MPEGYSSLGGQVLVPSDTDKTPGGSSGGSAAATAAGLAALTIGLETSTDTAAADRAGGRRRRRRPQADGRPRQPRRHPAGRQVAGRARARSAARSTTSRSRSTRSPVPIPTTRRRRARRSLRTTRRASCRPRLQGKRIAVISSSTAPYPAMVSARADGGRDDGREDDPDAEPEPGEHRRRPSSSAT